MNYSPKNQSLKNQSAYKPSFKSQSLKLQSLKARSLKTLIIAIVGLISLSNNPASATPVLNHQGDYVGSTIMGYQAWEVVDSDPRGLNCRMKQEFQPAILDAMDLPVALEENYQHNIVNWNVVFSFSPGERLKAVIGNGRFNQIMRMDAQGRPWLGVRTWKGDCFVRANNRFVRPVGTPGWQ